MTEINPQNYYNVPNNDGEVVEPDMPVDTGAIVDPSGIEDLRQEPLRQETPVEQVNPEGQVTPEVQAALAEVFFALDNTRIFLKQYHYNNLVAALLKAKKAGVNIPDYIKAQMPELRREVALAEVSRAFYDTQQFLTRHNYYRLVHEVETAEKLHLNVSHIKDKIPGLYRAVVLAEVSRAFKKAKECLTQRDYDRLFIEIEIAKKEGVDVSDIEAQMPELHREVALAEVYRALDDTQKFLTQGYYDRLLNKVRTAKKAGVNIPDYIEAQMPELHRAVALAEVSRALDEAERLLTVYSFQYFKESVEAAINAGIDVSVLESKMRELEQRCVN